MKRLLIFLLIVILAGFAFVFRIYQKHADGVPILLYRQVNNSEKEDSSAISVETFEEQMKYLKDSGYSVMTLDELIDAWEKDSALPEKPAVLTFDEGYIDVYKNVFPILQKYNMKATMFVVTDHVNLYPNYVTWEQAKEMQESGLVDVESKTLSGKDLTKIYYTEKLWDQIYGSKQAIEWYLKKPAKFISFPLGKYTVGAEAMSQEVGYRAGLTSNYGLAHKEPVHYILDRIPVYGGKSQELLRFKLRLVGAPLIEPMSRFKARLTADGNEEIASLIWIP